MNTGLPLLDWQPASEPIVAETVIPFPVKKRRRGEARAADTGPSALVKPFQQDRRHAKVQDVATKLLATRTDRHAAHYREQVSEAMFFHLRARHVPLDQHPEQVRRFWQAVDCEVARRVNGRCQPGGAA